MGPTATQTRYDAILAGMNTPGAAVAVPTPAPSRGYEDPQPCLYVTTLIELFTQDQSPAGALLSLLAMCWYWPPESEGEEKDLFLGSALLSLGRLLRHKLACLAEDMADCLLCHRDAKEDKRLVMLRVCGRL